MKHILRRVFMGVSVLLLLSLGILVILQERYNKNQLHRERIAIADSLEDVEDREDTKVAEELNSGFTLADLERMEQSESQEEDVRQEDSYEASTDKISRITITINGDAQRSRGFTWYTAGQNAENYNDLQVVEANGDGLHFSDGQNVRATDGIASYEEGSFWHKAVAEGLKPDTKYYFRIGNALDNEWSKAGYFVTFGKKEYTFVSVSDTQENESESDFAFSADGMATALAETPEAAFMIQTGDMVSAGDVEEKWRELFDLSRNTFMNITLVPSAGNHESQHNAFEEHFNLPTQDIDIKKGVYYSFDAGCAHYVVLNTNVSSDEIEGIGPEQYEWLQADIKDARYNGAIWIIVVMHKGAYTVAMHSEDDEIIAQNGIRNKLASKLEELGVDLVIQGHDHYPTCTGILKDGKRSEEGTVFLEAGAMGPSTHSKNSSLSQEYLDLFDYIAPDERADNTYKDFAKIDISENNLKIEMREIDVTKEITKSNILYQKILTK